MGCTKSKNDTPPAVGVCDLTYTLPYPVKRSYSAGSSTLNRNYPRFNDNKLLKLKHLSNSLQMEAELLEDLNTRMPRYSTAEHDLSSFEGMVLADDENGDRYTQFKVDLITYKPLKLQFVAGIPEAIAGQTTPAGFPGYTKVERCGNAEIIPIYAVVNKKNKKKKCPVPESNVNVEHMTVRRTARRNRVRVLNVAEVHQVHLAAKICGRGQ